MISHRRLRAAAAAVALLLAGGARAAGTLTPTGSPYAPIEIREHHVDVVINNGFARTEVQQTFFNPNSDDLEGIYAFPVPKSASLSEVTVLIGELEIEGEVVERDRARAIYESERDRGRDAGLASKQAFDTFEFRVSPIRAGAETRVRFAYYQPLEIDTGIGRYAYPLEDGGVDELAKQFWLTHDVVRGPFSIDVELKSAWPVTDVRAPGFEGDAVVTPLGEGHYRLRVERPTARLDRDFVLYYRLQDGLPGRVEVIPFRDDERRPGTFMAVVTPGLDLQPITGGSDYAFVLDVSGSMSGKLLQATRAIGEALRALGPDDRFRLVTFEAEASELTGGWVQADPTAVEEWAHLVEQLHAGGGTNMFAGLRLGLDDLDDDRATALVLMTDAVTNQGVVDPARFHELMSRYDVRVFGFLIGNNANWPLMRIVADASGGFYAPVSSADDVIGQLLLARSKITHEALHDAELTVRGAKTFDTTGEVVGKVYRGQQLVLFGRYAEPGPATLRLEARLTGADRVYETDFDLPAIDTDHPELERLWAMSRIEELERLADLGLLPPAESDDAVLDLGLAYQLVTDQTSMLVLADDAFARHGIDRHNRDRVARERAARARRSAQPVRDHRVDRRRPTFEGDAPGIGGGGAFDPVTGAIALGLGAAATAAHRRRRGGRQP